MSESGEESKSRHSKCHNAECGKTFSTRSNRDRHEKKVGHTPAQRRNSIQVPIFNKDLNEYCCPNCLVTSKFKSNITRHVKKGCKTRKTTKHALIANKLSLKNQTEIDILKGFIQLMSLIIHTQIQMTMRCKFLHSITRHQKH